MVGYFSACKCRYLCTLFSQFLGPIPIVQSVARTNRPHQSMAFQFIIPALRAAPQSVDGPKCPMPRLRRQWSSILGATCPRAREQQTRGRVCIVVQIKVFSPNQGVHFILRGAIIIMVRTLHTVCPLP